MGSNVPPAEGVLSRAVPLVARPVGISATLLVDSTVARALLSTYLALTYTPPVHVTVKRSVVRIEYPTEIHYVGPNGKLIRIVKKYPMPPALRWYPRMVHH